MANPECISNYVGLASEFHRAARGESSIQGIAG